MPPSPNKLHQGKGAYPIPFHLQAPNLPEPSVDYLGPDPLSKLDTESADHYKLFRSWVELHPQIRRFAAMAAEKMAATTGIAVDDKLVFALARANDWVKRLDTFEAMMFEVAMLEQRRAISTALAHSNMSDVDAIETAKAILAFHRQHPEKSTVEGAARLLQEAFERLAIKAGVRPLDTVKSGASSDAKDLAAKLDRLFAGMQEGDALAVLESMAEEIPPEVEPGSNGDGALP